MEHYRTTMPEFNRARAGQAVPSRNVMPSLQELYERAAQLNIRHEGASVDPLTRTVKEEFDAWCNLAPQTCYDILEYWSVSCFLGQLK